MILNKPADDNKAFSALTGNIAGNQYQSDDFLNDIAPMHVSGDGEPRRKWKYIENDAFVVIIYKYRRW